MRLPRPETTTIVLITLLLALNGALYGGIFEGFDPGQAATFVELTPTAEVTPSAADLAELDDSRDLPGEFVPTQGRSHTERFPNHEPVPFCPEGERDDDCYASNPPTSGLHLPTARNVPVGDGNVINLPPDPGIYAFEIPRESIPHLQEHAGVFVGYNCASQGCRNAARDTERTVEQELSLGARVIMAPDSDLPEDTFGLASWTRVDTFPAGEYNVERVQRFIKAHSCRFDPEGFCAREQTN